MLISRALQFPCDRERWKEKNAHVDDVDDDVIAREIDDNAENSITRVLYCLIVLYIYFKNAREKAKAGLLIPSVTYR